jgi:hypothetical protein
MMREDRIYDMDKADLEDQVLGKRVVSVEEYDGTITLDDGTVLSFIDTADCCAWFSAELRAGTLSDNIVTAVRLEEFEGGEYGEEHYALHILATDTRIGTVEINGDPSNGYYCHSIELGIERKPIA